MAVVSQQVWGNSFSFDGWLVLLQNCLCARNMVGESARVNVFFVCKIIIFYPHFIAQVKTLLKQTNVCLVYRKMV